MARTGAGGIVVAALAALASGMAGDACAHGGGLDRHGCHNDRKRGGYHCHGGTSAPASRATPNAYDFAPSSLAPSRATPRAGAYANCSEARAAGAAPVRRGDPGYGPHLDRDGDGVGCEPRR
ncbi:MAG: excalibur calcium-binding domain-containing protein [Pseudomonadota bacterium]